jgi:hypothetical protein
VINRSKQKGNGRKEGKEEGGKESKKRQRRTKGRGRIEGREGSEKDKTGETTAWKEQMGGRNDRKERRAE